jgi:hypothetical protein
VISTCVVPSINRRSPLTLDKAIEEARLLFEKQVQFARMHRLRETGMSQSAAGDAFAAFYQVEYGAGVSEAELARAWADIEKALINLYGMSDLWQLLGRSKYLISQRSLTYSCGPAAVQARPDLVAFYIHEPPLIIDWKVHLWATQDYRLQLACYAVALTQCKPHKDFPPSLANCAPQDVCALEVQLLTNQQRNYALSEEDVEATDAHIALSARNMLLAMGDPIERRSEAFDFPPAMYPATCNRCPFRSMCWEKQE